MSMIDKSTLSNDECYETATYWLTSGWAKGIFEYKETKHDALPTQVEGWQWMNEWTVVLSPEHSDADGWIYASSLNDLSTCNTQKEANTMSMFRRRKFIRSRICISHSIRDSIENQVSSLEATALLLAESLQDKQKEKSEFVAYEKTRSLRSRHIYIR